MPELEPDLERAAADLWRKENPEMSVFACDAAMQERYRKRVLEIECPCCHGRKYLLVHSEAEPDAPPVKVGCCHCAELGVVAPDNRSMNVHE